MDELSPNILLAISYIQGEATLFELWDHVSEGNVSLVQSWLVKAVHLVLPGGDAPDAFAANDVIIEGGNIVIVKLKVCRVQIL